MKRSSKIIALLGAVVLAASCSPKTSVSVHVADAAGEKLAVHKLGVGMSELMDSVTTDTKGCFEYKLDVTEGQPEFIYVFRGATRIAALILEKGDKAVVEADTLGNYSVSGSVQSEALCEVEKAYSEFMKNILSAEDSRTATKTYIDYYRSRVQYVLSNTKSLSSIQVLYQNVSPDFPVFDQPTDAITFRVVCDSLKTVYPESIYVKALERETKRRENSLGLMNTLRNAQVAGFPDLILPNTNSEPVSLAGVDAKAILVHFWVADDPEQKLFNVDTLLPLYQKYHKKGFEIYSVCLSTDKALWASVVRNQKLPWINVCDGYGAYSKAITLYNVREVPTTILIANGEISTADIKGADGLSKTLSKILK